MHFFFGFHQVLKELQSTSFVVFIEKYYTYGAWQFCCLFRICARIWLGESQAFDRTHFPGRGKRKKKKKKKVKKKKIWRDRKSRSRRSTTSRRGRWRSPRGEEGFSRRLTSCPPSVMPRLLSLCFLLLGSSLNILAQGLKFFPFLFLFSSLLLVILSSTSTPPLNLSN